MTSRLHYPGEEDASSSTTAAARLARPDFRGLCAGHDRYSSSMAGSRGPAHDPAIARRGRAAVAETVGGRFESRPCSDHAPQRTPSYRQHFPQLVHDSRFGSKPWLYRGGGAAGQLLSRPGELIIRAGRWRCPAARSSHRRCRPPASGASRTCSRPMHCGYLPVIGVDEAGIDSERLERPTRS